MNEHTTWCADKNHGPMTACRDPHAPNPSREQAAQENGLAILEFWKQRAADLQEALEGMCYQFGYWHDSVGGVGTGGLSALELSFEFLGWGDPHPVPEMRCKVKDCMKQNTVGWPCLDEGHRYHQTCGEHWRSMEGAPHEATP